MPLHFLSGVKRLRLEIIFVLPRSGRLSTREFAVAFENGQVFRHPLFQMRLYRRSDGNPVTRAAFVVPKKLGKAVWRNRLRRRVRERFRITRQHADWAGALQQCDLIFLIGPQSETATAQQIDQALTQLARRVKS